MRYVIVIAAIAFFLIWDGLYNHGHYLDVTVREMSRIVRQVTDKASPVAHRWRDIVAG